MPIHVTTRNKRDTVTFLSDVDVDFVSLVDHGANWTPFTLIKHHAVGVSIMPGQVIQAIIMPLERDIAELQRLYGQEWFNRVDTAKREDCTDEVRYVQREESDFEEFDRDAAFILHDIGDTGGRFVVGTLKAGKRNEPALEVPTKLTAGDHESVETNRSPNDDKGECMTVDEITNLIAESTAAAEARMMEKVEKRLGEVERASQVNESRQPAGELNPDNADTDDPAGKSDSQDSLEGIIRQLDALSDRVKKVVEKQEALEHAAVGRPSMPEDSSIGRGPVSPFRGMFAGL